ncbi:hypothetical protein Dimus_031040 [Dionaea muscipula]
MASSSSTVIPFLLLLILHLSSSSSAAKQQQKYSSSISHFPWSPAQNRSLQSPNSIFTAGFVPTPNTSQGLYIFSVWYTDVPGTLLWSVGSPVVSSASITILPSGQLHLANSSSDPNVWPGHPSGGSNFTLGDEGNLVFGDWESFKFPTNTYLPKQNITGTNLTSANSKYGFDGSRLIYNGSDVYWTTSAFQRFDSNGLVTLSGGTIFSSDFGSSLLRRLTLEDKGNLNLYSYDNSTSKWVVVWQAFQVVCWIHGLCDPNEICYNNGSNDDSTTCECPYPSSSVSNGACEIPYSKLMADDSQFVSLDYVNYSSKSYLDSSNAPNYTMCEKRCLDNPDCVGFGFKYQGNGYCSPLLGMLQNGYWLPDSETTMFLRVNKNASSPRMTYMGMTEVLNTTCPATIRLLDPPEEPNTMTRNKVIIIAILFTAELVIGVVSFWAFLDKYVKYRDMARTLGLELLPGGGPKRFSYAEIKEATKGFSGDNMIGRGGFGDVYKGVMSDHRIVAVKCLRNVAGGDAEFWAEVTIISRMHHLNLVRLWGFCSEKGKRILVYEYVPNGSLDKYLFRSSHSPNYYHSSTASASTSDTEHLQAEEIRLILPEENRPLLDWNIRYRIAVGVARAIAYLHEECLEWVLHCDIKPENILLGDDFCPKITDFGLSKLRKKEQAVTISRIKGTRGYMAPEWIRSNYPISPKADVYSFGIVLLEMVTGTRSFETQESEMESAEWYFPRWAFDKVEEEKLEVILDRNIKHIYDSKQHFEIVTRMVKTALWCIQEKPDTRPSMGKAAKMLEGTVEIMEPPKPTIFYSPDEE